MSVQRIQELGVVGLCLFVLVYSLVNLYNFAVTPPPEYTFPAETVLLRTSKNLNIGVLSKEPGIFAGVDYVPKESGYSVQNISRLETGEFVVIFERHMGYPVTLLFGVAVGIAGPTRLIRLRRRIPAVA